MLCSVTGFTRFINVTQEWHYGICNIPCCISTLCLFFFRINKGNWRGMGRGYEWCDQSHDTLFLFAQTVAICLTLVLLRRDMPQSLHLRVRVQSICGLGACLMLLTVCVWAENRHVKHLGQDNCTVCGLVQHKHRKLFLSPDFRSLIEEQFVSFYCLLFNLG